MEFVVADDKDVPLYEFTLGHVDVGLMSNVQRVYQQCTRDGWLYVVVFDRPMNKTVFLKSKTMRIFVNDDGRVTQYSDQLPTSICASLYYVSPRVRVEYINYCMNAIVYYFSSMVRNSIVNNDLLVASHPESLFLRNVAQLLSTGEVYFINQHSLQTVQKDTPLRRQLVLMVDIMRAFLFKCASSGSGGSGGGSSSGSSPSSRKRRRKTPDQTMSNSSFNLSCISCKVSKLATRFAHLNYTFTHTVFCQPVPSIKQTLFDPENSPLFNFVSRELPCGADAYDGLREALVSLASSSVVGDKRKEAAAAAQLVSHAPGGSLVESFARPRIDMDALNEANVW